MIFEWNDGMDELFDEMEWLSENGEEVDVDNLVEKYKNKLVIIEESEDETFID